MQLIRLLSTTAMLALSACQSSSPGQPSAPSDDIPAHVNVSGGSVTSGTTMDRVRNAVSVNAFSISKTPTTVGQYRQCVDAGVCSAPAIQDGACTGGIGNFGATFSTNHDHQPVTCVSPDQAAQYCSWVGGRLPTVSEWLLAARGETPVRYAWGQVPPTCSERPNIRFGAPRDCCGNACDGDKATSVGKHPDGDSPNGVSDVLITASELLASDSKAGEPACSPPVNACAVTGLLPGAIDLFAPAADGKTPLLSSNAAAASFRCVWGGAS